VSSGTAYALAGILVVGGLIAVLLLEGVPYERQIKLERPTSAD
jgi:hypothetical protein